MFGLKKKKKAAPPGDADENHGADGDDEAVKEADRPKAKDKIADKDADKGGAEDEPATPAKSNKPAAPGSSQGKLGMILGFGLITLIAGGAGAGAGMFVASSFEATYAARQKAEAEIEKAKPAVVAKYTGDRVLQRIDPVITNLAAPTDVWIRLESSMIFANGAIKDPQTIAAEIRQDILAYCRTITLDQLEGPSALQHLREDLSERVSLRTSGAVSEFVIETLVVQ